VVDRKNGADHGGVASYARTEGHGIERTPKTRGSKLLHRNDGGKKEREKTNDFGVGGWSAKRASS